MHTNRYGAVKPDRAIVTIQRLTGPGMSYLIVALVALVLRVTDLGGFVTIDEAKFWLPRSQQFLLAVQTGDYGGIPVVGHPGVTTMWLGSAGIALRRALFEHGWLHQETYPLLLTLHRLPAALTHVVGILVGYALLRRMFAARVALLAGLLWATDPFVLAFSRILHVDGLAGTFMTVSILAACYVWLYRARVRWLIVSALCAGLAIVSKFPALIVLPIAASVALLSFFDEYIHSKERTEHKDAQSSLVRLLIWGTLCAVTIVAIWPIFWVEPAQAYHALRYGVESEGGQPHMWGNFFMGQPVDVPGPLFYPVALVLRTTPFSLVGLLVLPFALKLHHIRLNNKKSPSTPSRQIRQDTHAIAATDNDIGNDKLTTARLRSLALLATCIVLFVVAMSIFPKKMNRYLVPIFPAVDILAAVGLAWLAERRLLPDSDTPNTKPRISRIPDICMESLRSLRFKYSTIATILLSSLMIINALWWHPYSVAAGNQLMGGARKGATTFLTGWGEGFDLVATWLNNQPDITSVVTVTNLRSVLQPYLRDSAYATSEEGTRLPDGAGYVVVYLSQAQRGLTAPYDQIHRQVPPLHTVTIHGVEYAWMYHAPRPMHESLDVAVGSALHVHGYEVDTAAIRSSGVLTLTLQWQARAPVPEDYNLFVHVFDANGHPAGQLDVPLLNAHAPSTNAPLPTSTWQPGRYVLWTHPVPVQVATDSCWIAVGLYRPSDFSRLPVQAPPQPGAPDDGIHALFLKPVRIK